MISHTSFTLRVRPVSPKGVEISHAAFANVLHAMVERFSVNADDVFGAASNIAFDAAVIDLYTALICGAAVALVPRETAYDGAKLAAFLDGHGVTIMFATPTTWHLLVAAGWKGSPRFHALSGGEALPPELAVQLRERCAAVWNVYGPTETTVICTAGTVDGGPITIGPPVTNMRVFVLDEFRRVVPRGVVGELHVAGVQLARGYRNRADLTTDRFFTIQTPSGSVDRVYATGDCVRMTLAGQLEYRGRNDTQVKIRGHRIETGEVEATLDAYPAIAQAVVVPSSDSTALVAYIVPSKRGVALDSGDLRAFLRNRLPEYMIPNCETIDALPLNVNGRSIARSLPSALRKVERRGNRLRAMQAGSASPGGSC